MRKVTIIRVKALIVIAILFAFATSNISSAAIAQEGKVINYTCPVMGGEVDQDTPYKTVYNDMTIGFCCPACVGKFNADPEKYMEKLEDICVINCPECGAEIDVTEKCKKSMMEDKCCRIKGMQPAE